MTRAVATLTAGAATLLALALTVPRARAVSASCAEENNGPACGQVEVCVEREWYSLGSRPWEGYWRCSRWETESVSYFASPEDDGSGWDADESEETSDGEGASDTTDAAG